MRLGCRRCKYEWDYQGRNPYYATCPYCFTKVSVRGCQVDQKPNQSKLK